MNTRRWYLGRACARTVNATLSWVWKKLGIARQSARNAPTEPILDKHRQAHESRVRSATSASHEARMRRFDQLATDSASEWSMHLSSPSINHRGKDEQEVRVLEGRHSQPDEQKTRVHALSLIGKRNKPSRRPVRGRRKSAGK